MAWNVPILDAIPNLMIVLPLNEDAGSPRQNVIAGGIGPFYECIDTTLPPSYTLARTAGMWDYAVVDGPAPVPTDHALTTAITHSNPQTILAGATEFTISTWVKVNPVNSQDTLYGFLYHEHGVTGWNRVGMALHCGNNAPFGVHNNALMIGYNNTWNYSADLVYATNVWFMATMIYDLPNLRVRGYINTTKVYEAAIVIPITNDASDLGTNVCYGLPAAQDQLVVWKHAIDDAELAALYNGGIGVQYEVPDSSSSSSSTSITSSSETTETTSTSSSDTSMTSSSSTSLTSLTSSSSTSITSESGTSSTSSSSSLDDVRLVIEPALVIRNESNTSIYIDVRKPVVFELALSPALHGAVLMRRDQSITVEKNRVQIATVEFLARLKVISVKEIMVQKRFPLDS